MMDYEVGSGDLLLFSRSAFKSNWLRFITYTNMEHIGIAIRSRLSPEELRHSLLEKSIDSIIEPGEPFDPFNTYLYVLDQTDKEIDFDFITGNYKIGFRLADYHMRKYNYRLIGYRSLRWIPFDGFRDRLLSFCKKYQDQHFLRGKHIIDFWLGFEPDIRYGQTCTMMASNFFREVLQCSTYQYLSSHNFNFIDKDPATLFVNNIYYHEVRLIYRKYEKIQDNIIFPLIVMIIILAIFLITFYKAFKKKRG